MKIKYLIIITMVFSLTLMITNTALANDIYDIEKTGTITVKTTNEKELYLNLLNTTDEELTTQGYSVDEIQVIRNDDIEERFLSLAMLEEQELENRGYTKEEISIIKQYNGEPITENSEILEVLASNTLSAWYTTATGYPCSTSQIGMRYNWRWDRAPIMLSTDVAAVAWSALDQGLGYPEADVLFTSNASSSPTRAYVRYANSSTEVIEDYEYISVDIRGIEDLAIAKFPMKSSAGLYAKSGYLQVVLKATDFQFDSALFGGNYGHTIINFSGAYSYQVRADHSVAISPSAQVDTFFADEIRMFTDGSWY